jgi:lipopolysaccharide export system protein LptC
MKLFSVKSFDATGRLQSEIKGEMARHYPDTDTLEVDKVRMRSVTPQGLVTLATADRALSNADGSEVQLFGNAVVTREAHRVALARRSRAWSSVVNSCTPSHRTERVRSDQPVVLTAATTASPPTPWNTTTLTRCCNCAGVCVAC